MDLVIESLDDSNLFLIHISENKNILWKYTDIEQPVTSPKWNLAF